MFDARNRYRAPRACKNSATGVVFTLRPARTGRSSTANKVCYNPLAISLSCVISPGGRHLRAIAFKSETP
jgi:hypothetical protein